MNLDVEMMKGILDVKCDCTVQELTGHVNNMTNHYGGGPFSEEDIIAVIKEIKDVYLIKTMPKYVLRVIKFPKFVPLDCSSVP